VRVGALVGVRQPLGSIESVATCVGRAVLDCKAALVVVVTKAGAASRFLSKYRPSVPVMVVTWSPAVARHTAGRFAQYPMLMDGDSPYDGPAAAAAAAAGGGGGSAEDVSRRLVDTGGAVDQALYRAKALSLFESRFAAHPVVVMVEDPAGRASLSFTYTNS
jgi:hypothetical protein